MKASTFKLAAAAFVVASAPGAALAAPSEVCWIEFSRSEAPGAMGAAGATAKIWRNTASGVLVRHPKGDVLIDAGWSSAVAAQMVELGPAKRPIAEQILAGLSWRVDAPQALAKVGERPQQLRYVLPTHAHYDHMAGAEDLPGAQILMTPEEIAFTKAQEATPDVVAASNIRAVKARFEPIRFTAKGQLGFARSFDLYGDGAVVIVPLPGHTPGSVGVLFTAGGKRVLHIGDATWVLEAVEKGLPKLPQLRAFADADGPAADAQVAALKAFHEAHPEVAILPAHDRGAWEAVFGPEPGCKR